MASASKSYSNWLWLLGTGARAPGVKAYRH